MADRWIKQIVGMFDGKSFKRIKRAKIDGEKFRDKLTAVWFELMDLAGQCNRSGALIDSDDIPFADSEDIATMLDREPEEVEQCLQYFINERMIAKENGIYTIAKWCEYQNEDGLEEIRRKNRERQAKFREKQKVMLEEAKSNVTDNITVMLHNAVDIDTEEEKDTEIDIKKESVSCQQIVDLYHSICNSFPSVRSLSEARKKAIKARLNTYTLDDFRIVFENAEASDFLKGRNDRNWTATFDWLIKDANMAKVLEGNYANKASRYGRKEPVPGWMGHVPGEAELEAIAKIAAEAIEPETVDNNPQLADEAEQLRQRMQQKYGKGSAVI